MQKLLKQLRTGFSLLVQISLRREGSEKLVDFQNKWTKYESELQIIWFNWDEMFVLSG